MPPLAENLSFVESRIAAACVRAGRLRESVELIAVSKTFPGDAVREASELGQRLFGESRLQEAEPKISVLPSSLRWHFIGGVQRNKVRRILPLFETIHAIDSLKLATYTDQVAAELGLFPKVFLQVNVAGEATKGGFEPEELRGQLDALMALGRLEIQGLMTIPPAGPAAESARPWFIALRELRDRLASDAGVGLPHLSMGMSSDYKVAINEGSTMVRIGSLLFGERTKK